MAIIDTLTQSGFIHAFRNVRPDNFTYNGLAALYDYLEELSEDIGENIEFDPIGLCCEYAEYKNLAELQQEHDVADMIELQDKTTVIMIDDESFIIQQY